MTGVEADAGRGKRTLIGKAVHRTYQHADPIPAQPLCIQYI
jgi:hypothetical protein